MTDGHRRMREDDSNMFGMKATVTCNLINYEGVPFVCLFKV